MRVTAKLRTFVERYQHTLSIGSFLVGFAVDTVLLKRIDLLISNALLITYLSVVALSMLLLHRYAARAPRFELGARALEWVPFAAQFAFGGMFSGFLIFYSQAGSVVASWPFLTLILALILSNEFLRSYQQRLAYQSILLFFCLFTFSIYAVPILLGAMSATVFELSGFVALGLTAGFVGLMWLIDARRVRMSLGPISIGVLGVYGLITALYFSNILPPIPLALKDIGVYHSVVPQGGDYVATAEESPWYERLTGVTVSLVPGSSLYAYSSVFAPTKLETQIVHRWERELDGRWETVSTIPFGIAGGRDGGYRGYSAFPAPESGRWRVSVETIRGQLIGREEFRVVEVTSTPVLSSRILR